MLLLQKYVSECDEPQTENLFDDSASESIHYGRDHCASLKYPSHSNIVDSFLVKSSSSHHETKAETNLKLSSSKRSSVQKQLLNFSKRKVRSPESDNFRIGGGQSGEIRIYTHQLVVALNAGKSVWL